MSHVNKVCLKVTLVPPRPLANPTFNLYRSLFVGVTIYHFSFHFLTCQSYTYIGVFSNVIWIPPSELVKALFSEMITCSTQRNRSFNPIKPLQIKLKPIS